MRKLVRKNGTPEAKRFKASNRWCKAFMRRSGLSWRRKTNTKVFVAENYVDKMVKWIDHLRQLRISSLSSSTPRLLSDSSLRLEPEHCEKLSTFCMIPPNATFNVDQVPLPFVVDDAITMEFTGANRVWVKQLGSGLDKRQATLQLLIRAEGVQPKPCLIFRGKPTHSGKRKANRENEANEYDPDVSVIWQRKAWADSDTCVEWADKHYAGFAPDDYKGENPLKLLLVDNLNGQTAQPFIDSITRTNTLLRQGVSGATDLWQPVDAGVGKVYKHLIGIYYNEWLESEEAEPYLEEGTIPVELRRVLMTKWVGRAYRELEARRIAAAPGQDIFYKAFLRTGALVTADGTADEEIRPQGLKGDFYLSLTPPSEIKARGTTVSSWTDDDGDSKTKTTPLPQKVKPVNPGSPTVRIEGAEINMNRLSDSDTSDSGDDESSDDGELDVGLGFEVPTPSELFLTMRSLRQAMYVRKND